MKKLLLLILSIIVFVTIACETIQKLPQQFPEGLPTGGEFPIGERFRERLPIWMQFNRKTPISTTFADANYEAESLRHFEPQQIEYRPLDIQPKGHTGGYVLKSGIYSMKVKSFCLRSHTHGPSRGDGHLYAPLKGKKANFVQSILERYGKKPHIPQKSIQVLLWAIVAGADMNTLGTSYLNTLRELFTAQELLKFRGNHWLNGMADEQISELRKLALNNVSPKLRNVLEADNKIRAMVQQNRSFQEIERIAIIAGVAPRRDMIREVSRGRWSYHPDGFFVRFFPSGYQQTKIDVYVPFEDEVMLDAAHKPHLRNTHSHQVKKVLFNPATMVAAPANQSSQRIGVSEVPTNPTRPNTNPEQPNRPNAGIGRTVPPNTNPEPPITNPEPPITNPEPPITNPEPTPPTPIPPPPPPPPPTWPTTDKYAITFLAYPPGKKYTDKHGKRVESVSGHVFVAFSRNQNIEQVKGFSPVMWSKIRGKVNENTDERYLLGYHDISFCVDVNKTNYQRAKSIRKEDYLIVYDDCVSYADDIADIIGLNTPTFVLDPLDFTLPMNFVRYLKRHNDRYRSTNCPSTLEKMAYTYQGQKKKRMGRVVRRRER